MKHRNIANSEKIKSTKQYEMNIIIIIMVILSAISPEST